MGILSEQFPIPSGKPAQLSNTPPIGNKSNRAYAFRLGSKLSPDTMKPESSHVGLRRFVKDLVECPEQRAARRASGAGDLINAEGVFQVFDNI